MYILYTYVEIETIELENWRKFSINLAKIRGGVASYYFVSYIYVFIWNQRCVVKRRNLNSSFIMPTELEFGRVEYHFIIDR